MCKRKLFIVIVMGIIAVLTLTGCNSDKSGEEQQAIQTSYNTENTFSVEYEGVQIVPGTEFNEDLIEEEANFSEIPSCAFDGTDKVYTYSGVEITVAQIDGKDIIYSVYFISDEVKTNEEVSIADTIDKMLETYGENYVQTLGNKYTYTKGNVELSFIIQNEVITSIEYVLKTDS